MNEIERILEKGVITPEFLKEEIRSETLVEESTKKIWAIELDLLFEFIQICKKYDLRYFMFWGSLLGTVRHKGFIPWDDDIDVALLREDYEKFLKVAPLELSSPYFLQTPYTDPGSYFSLARLRNSNTTGMIKTFSHNNFNQGIWLDIEVLDYCDVSKIDETRSKIFERVMKCATYMRKGSSFLDAKRKSELDRYRTDNPLKDFEEIHSIAAAMNQYCKDYLNVANVTAYPPEKQTWRSCCFTEFVDSRFEGIDVKIPAGYDEIT